MIEFSTSLHGIYRYFRSHSRVPYTRRAHQTRNGDVKTPRGLCRRFVSSTHSSLSVAHTHTPDCLSANAVARINTLTHSLARNRERTQRQHAHNPRSGCFSAPTALARAGKQRLGQSAGRLQCIGIGTAASNRCSAKVAARRAAKMPRFLPS